MSICNIQNSKNIDELYFESIDKIQNSKEYQQNQMQIDCIRKVLIEHINVPPVLIDWLIESVQENVALEYEASRKFLNNYSSHS